jgi:hypothetical protein
MKWAIVRQHNGKLFDPTPAFLSTLISQLHTWKYSVIRQPAFGTLKTETTSASEPFIGNFLLENNLGSAFDLQK